MLDMTRSNLLHNKRQTAELPGTTSQVKNVTGIGPSGVPIIRLRRMQWVPEAVWFCKRVRIDA
jgi:hypothetical protein